MLSLRDDNVRLRQWPAGERFETFGAAQGLRGQSVYAVHEDATGLLWARTSTGLYSFHRAAGGFRDDVQPPGFEGLRGGT